MLPRRHYGQLVFAASMCYNLQDYLSSLKIKTPILSASDTSPLLGGEQPGWSDSSEVKNWKSVNLARSIYIFWKRYLVNWDINWLYCGFFLFFFFFFFFKGYEHIWTTQGSVWGLPARVCVYSLTELYVGQESTVIESASSGKACKGCCFCYYSSLM